MMRQNLEELVQNLEEHSTRLKEQEVQRHWGDSGGLFGGMERNQCLEPPEQRMVWESLVFFHCMEFLGLNSHIQG